VRAYRKEGGGIAGNDTDSRVKNIFFSSYEAGDQLRTEFEKIYARAIAADVKVVVEQATSFEAQLGEVVAAIVTDEHEPAWFK
jgi:hypothetical protein